jgi:hypothetical protein
VEYLRVGPGETLLVIAGLLAILLVLGGLGFVGLRWERARLPFWLHIPLAIALSLLVGLLMLVAPVLLGILANA